MKKDKLKACLNCRFLTEGEKCPLCGSEDLTTNWQDAVLIVSEESVIAKKSEINKKGIFALQIK